MMKKSWLVLFLIVCLCMTALSFPAHAEGLTGRLELIERTIMQNGITTELETEAPFETWFFEDETHIYVTNGARYTYKYVPATEKEKAYIELDGSNFINKRITLEENYGTASFITGSARVSCKFTRYLVPRSYKATIDSAAQNGSALDFVFSAVNSGISKENTFHYHIYADGVLESEGTTTESSLHYLPKKDASYTFYLTAENEYADYSDYAKKTVSFKGDPDYVIDKGVITSYNKGRSASDDKKIIVADSILDMQVTGIGANAFSGATELTSITLPKDITTIDDSAFNGCNAVFICDPTGSTAKELARIGKTFYDNDDTTKNFSLTYQTDDQNQNHLALAAYTGKESTVTVPDSVEYIQANAFSGSAVEKIILPKDLENIAPSAFAYCQAKIFCELDGETAKKLSDMRQVFYAKSDSEGEYGLQYMKVVGEENAELKLALIAFTPVTDETKVSAVVPDYVQYIFTGAFKGNRVLEKVTIPKGVTGIGTEAFMNCSKLSEVTFEDPDSSAVKTIGERAFCNCVSLERLDLPANITSIADNAFENCPAKLYCSASGETGKTLSAKNGSFNVEDKDKGTEMTMRYDGDDLVLCSYSGTDADVAIPDGVNAIADGAFDEVKAIMKTITIPASVKTVSSGAFDGFDKLVSIEFAEGTALEPGAIQNCQKLASVTDLSDDLTVIDTNFDNCPALLLDVPYENIRLAKGVSFAEKTAFTLSASDVKTHSTVGKVAVYQDGAVIANGVGSTKIYFCADGKIGIVDVTVVSGLTGMQLPAALTEIEDEAFRGGSAQYVVIPDTVTAIGANAFANNKALRFVNIPDGLTPAADAFAGDDALVAFVTKGSTAESWCKDNGITFQYAAE